ncbi:MAG: hypothetical protein FJW23_14525 [Acidimicrobiia bacterium]|nr:hypothetical protein [Acidimicrobiia bacterium]
MAVEPLDLTLELAPRSRFEVVELRSRFRAEHDALAAYPRCLYWSAHTTAGFLDRSISHRLRPAGVPPYVDAFRTMFPEGAGYEHDQLERRLDLDAGQRAVEPRNADSHLAFIAGGLRSCVTHPNRPDEAVCFVELDGVSSGRPRRRQTRVIGFTTETTVERVRLAVPVSSHPIDSINLKDPRLGLLEQLADLVRRSGAARGRLVLTLGDGERHSGLTVNEFETLLMQYDLAEVLRNPLRFAAEKSRHALANLRAVPGKARDYAKYDFVRVLNSGLDSLGLRGSVVERLLARTLAVPAARFFRMQRSISLLVATRPDGSVGFVEGPYQSPILVQWRRAPRETRTLEATLTELR